MSCQFELLDTQPDADGKFTIFCQTCTQFVRKSRPTVKTYRECVAPINTSTGVGTKLKEVLAKFNIRFSSRCKCREYMLIMNQWGIEGCQANFPVIVGWLKKEYKRMGWELQIAHAVKIRMTVDFPVDWNRPFESFVREAIRLATDHPLPAAPTGTSPA